MANIEALNNNTIVERISDPVGDVSSGINSSLGKVVASTRWGRGTILLYPSTSKFLWKGNKELEAISDNSVIATIKE